MGGMSQGYQPEDGGAAVPLRLDGVHFSYRGEEVLRGIDLSVAPGEVLALVGDNGAGKSTIARLAVGELRPVRGRVLLFGEDPQHFHDWARMGYLPQLPPEAVSRFPASVYELMDASQLRGRRGLAGKGHRARSASVLGCVGMEAFGHRLIRELSGGQLQRVRLACALVNEPDLLVLDEPTTGLDAESRSTFYGLVAQAHESQGLAVLLVTHDADALDALGCSVVEVSDGLATRRGE